MAGFGRSFRTVILILGLVVLSGLALYGAMEYTSRSAFCADCHEMEPAVKTWQSSGHRLVECIKCHSDPGPVGLVRTKIQALKEVYRHVTNTYHKPISFTTDKSVFNNRCLGCHKGISGRGAAHNTAHLSSGINCTDCHQGLVHNAQTNRQMPTRKVCIRCHGEEIRG